jgi:hypothetical protein
LTDGTYFGIDTTTGNLYSIDVSTGNIGLVGPTLVTQVPTGCSFEASLTGSGSALYYTIGSTGVGTACTAFKDTLYQIDPTNGNSISIGQVTVGGSGVNVFIGSTLVAGTLYGFTSNGKEYTIDPNPADTTAGVATFVANTIMTGTNTTVSIIAAGASK